MTDRIDQEGRATFVQTLPRKVTELRATLGTLVADPRSQRMRDELRRRLHALYTLTRSYNLPTLSEGLREGIAHLDAVRGASILTQRDLETLADLIATLSALAQRDLPDQPNLFQRGREPSGNTQAPPAQAKPVETTTSPTTTSASSSRRSSQPPASAKAVIGSLPPMPARLASQRPTQTGVPIVVPTAAKPIASTPTAPLGILVVAAASVTAEIKRALPPEMDIHAVHTLAEAVMAARDTAPDVIIAESASPADGLGLLVALRGDALTDFLPVVLLAAASDGIDSEQARAQGASELLTLPIDHDRLRDSVERAAQGTNHPSIPPTNFGELTLEELTRALQEEIRKGILGAAGPRANNARIALGQGSEVLAATWEAIARVRDVVQKRTHGKVRFEMPGSTLGIPGAHVLSIGGDDEPALEEDTASDDPLPGRHALVVDDDPGVVWFFAGLLREAGMLVTECTDGAQALRDARRIRPDVVISDILMPGVDGFALCRAIRRDVSVRHTPVILLSWKEDLLVRMRELGAQAQGFLRKESRGEAILGRVRAVLRPRVRLLRRLENLAEGAELRGRVERVGVFALLEATSRTIGDATLTITDSFSVTELELREQQLVAIVRTLQDGSLVRGESALLQVLGISNARFALQRASHSVRANVQGEISKLLEGGAALITALEDSLSGASLLEVASLDIDSDAALAYARSLPTAMRALIERIASGESPRNLILRDGIAPQELEPMLVELARRGAIRSVRGGEGQDLVAPRYAAAQSEESIRPEARASQPPKDSGTMPAVLKVPDASAASADAGTRESKSESVDEIDLQKPRKPTKDELVPPERAEWEQILRETAGTEAQRAEGKPAAAQPWTPPTTVDEAARRGFGLERDRDSLADAVLRELSDESRADDGPETTTEESEIDLSMPLDPTKPSATETGPVMLTSAKRAELDAASASLKASGPSSRVEVDDDTPEIAEEESEEALSDDELKKAARSSPGLPLAGVQLDARGLPRKTTSVPDLPELQGPQFDPHEPVRKSQDTSPSSSIIVDEGEIGGPISTAHHPRSLPPRPGAATTPPPKLTHPYSEKSSMPIWWLVLGVLALGGASYVVMRFFILPRAGSNSSESHGLGPGGSLDNPSIATVSSDAGSSMDASRVDQATVVANSATLDAGGGFVPLPPMTVIVDGGLAGADGGDPYEDPGRYVDAGVLNAGRGLLVIDVPAGGNGEILVDQRPIERGTNLVQLVPGVHTVRYRNNAVVVFRFVPIRAGRASRIALSVDR